MTRFSSTVGGWREVLRSSGPQMAVLLSAQVVGASFDALRLQRLALRDYCTTRRIALSRRNRLAGIVRRAGVQGS
jgi:hypothetical protein